MISDNSSVDSDAVVAVETVDEPRGGDRGVPAR